MTERERQLRFAQDWDMEYMHTFQCDDEVVFVVVAATEKQAWRVLNAERPHMGAAYLGKEEVK